MTSRGQAALAAIAFTVAVAGFLAAWSGSKDDAARRIARVAAAAVSEGGEAPLPHHRGVVRPTP
jgi:hypothetical protein